jgi:hypothetical protein
MRKTVFCFAGSILWSVVAFGQNVQFSSIDSQRAFVNQYCAGCHNDASKSGGFSWTQVDLGHPDQQAELLEKVVLKVRSGMMPPPARADLIPQR